MIAELLLVSILSMNIVILTCIYFIPSMVEKTVRDELKRLFEGE